ncbi:hypothetical protein H8B09_03375 [Paenibacillus sp. PR3]|uniref:Uncharacterized protein n=1 Tax=Paenibacillus terricola TaxID=2763503 RepID=A0ABR8MP65_9BACL|nr:hypothetical protein [Paenibacillus terricola]MBD3917780.1 hypothetical protein [Paenibacillus terricola]
MDNHDHSNSNHSHSHSHQESTDTGSGADVPVFNDVTSHYQNIMGVPSKKADLKSMPGPVRWFGYFFYAAIIALAAIFVVSYIVNR